MFPLDKYAKIKGVTTRTVYRWLEDGNSKIEKVMKDGDPYIIDPDLKPLTKESREVLIREYKNRFDAELLCAAATGEQKEKVIERITEEISRLSFFGVEIRGYSAKSCYRKIHNPKRLKRQSRDDKGRRKNPILKDPQVRERILKFASNIYLRIANKNVSQTAKLLKLSAPGIDELFEVADKRLPITTLYDFLKDEFDRMGLDELHDYLNSYNLWYKKRVHVTGAFTDDIEVFDYYVGDDHEFDFFVNVWNEREGEFESVKPRIWSWREAKTMKVLAFSYTTDSLKAYHLQTSLAQAVMKYGLPQKGLSIDNGIGKSDEMKDFYLKLGITPDTKITEEEIGLKRRAPYHSTGGATIERSHKFEKDEYAVFEPNFIGDNHKIEGRHTTNCLTPPKPLKLEDEVENQFTEYIYGRYETLPRLLTINGKKHTISIRDYFEQYYQTYELIKVDDITIRNAFYSEEYTTGFDNKLKFKGEYYKPLEYMGHIYNGKKYRVSYNPGNLNSIDLYAAEYFEDPHTGEIFEPEKSHVVTLECIRNIPVGEKAAKVNKINRQSRKHMKELAKTYIDKGYLDNPDAHTMVQKAISGDGSAIDERKHAARELEVVIGMEAEEKAQEIAKRYIDTEKAVKNNNKPKKEMSDDELYQSDPALGGRAGGTELT